MTKAICGTCRGSGKRIVELKSDDPRIPRSDLRYVDVCDDCHGTGRKEVNMLDALCIPLVTCPSCKRVFVVTHPKQPIHCPDCNTLIELEE